MSSNKEKIFDYTEKKFFRLSGKKIREAITSKIAMLEARREELLDQIEPEVKDSTLAAVAIVSVLDPKNTSADTLMLRACATECFSILEEIQSLSMVARNIIDDTILFYDLNEHDMIRFGL